MAVRTAGLCCVLALALMLYALPAHAERQSAPGPVISGAEYAAMLAAADRGDPLEKFEWFRKLPPDRQERLRENYRKYQALNPEERQRLKRRMERFRELSPEDKERMKKRLDRWRRMSPDEREKMRDRYRRFRELPQEKQEKIKKRFRDIKELPSDERRKKLRELKKELKRDNLEPGPVPDNLGKPDAGRNKWYRDKKRGRSRAYEEDNGPGDDMDDGGWGDESEGPYDDGERD